MTQFHINIQSTNLGNAGTIRYWTIFHTFEYFYYCTGLWMICCACHSKAEHWKRKTKALWCHTTASGCTSMFCAGLYLKGGNSPEYEDDMFLWKVGIYLSPHGITNQSNVADRHSQVQTHHKMSAITWNSVLFPQNVGTEETYNDPTNWFF
jgi:hypothetical protein